MKGRFESLIVGGAMLFGSIAGKRVLDAAERVESLAAEVEETRREIEDAPAPIPGMPLPTGYGLQVRGPRSEEIVVPVCLPPGFELDSMMLVPEFLPQRARDAAKVPVTPTSPHGPVPVAPAAAVPDKDEDDAEEPAERMAGTVQMVFGAAPEYRTSLDATPIPLPVPLEVRTTGIETHQLH
jgi:hypothetical protein